MRTEVFTLETPWARAARAIALLEAEAATAARGAAEAARQAEEAARARDTAREWAMDRLSLAAGLMADALRDEARQLREAYDVEDEEYSHLKCS